MKLRALLAAVGIALTVAVSGVGSPAAAAGAGCGSTCEGQDPATFKAYFDGLGYACAQGARTIHTEVGSEGTITLKYSDRCRTAWVTASYNGYDHPTMLPYRIESFYTNGTRRLTYPQIPGKHYTYMVNDAGLLARACWYEGNTSTDCTLKY